MRVSHLLALLALCTGAVQAETELKGLAGLREEAKAGIEMKLGDLLSVEEEEELENEADATGRRRRRRRRRWGHSHNPHHHNPHHHRPHHHNPHSHRPHSHRPHAHQADNSHLMHDHSPHSHFIAGKLFSGDIKGFMKGLLNFGDWCQKIYKNRNKQVSNAGAKVNGDFYGKNKAEIEGALKAAGIPMRGGCNGLMTKDAYGKVIASSCKNDQFDPYGDGTITPPGQLTKAQYYMMSNAQHPSGVAGNREQCEKDPAGKHHNCLWQGLDGQEVTLAANTYTSCVNPRTTLGNSAPNNRWARYSGDTAIAAGVPRVPYELGAVAELAWYYAKKSNLVEKRACAINSGVQCARIYFHKQHAVGKAKVYPAHYRTQWGARIITLPGGRTGSNNDPVEGFNPGMQPDQATAEALKRNMAGYARKQYALYDSYSDHHAGKSSGNGAFFIDTRGAKDVSRASWTLEGGSKVPNKMFYGISNIVWFNNFNSVMSNDAIVMHAEKAFLTDGFGTINGMSGLLEENATAERTTTEAAAENLELYESYLAELKAKEASLGSLLEKKAAAGSTVAWGHFVDDMNEVGDAVVYAANWVEKKFTEMVDWIKKWVKLLEVLDKIMTERDRVEAAILSQSRTAMQLVEGSKDHNSVAALQFLLSAGAPPCLPPGGPFGTTRVPTPSSEDEAQRMGCYRPRVYVNRNWGWGPWACPKVAATCEHKDELITKASSTLGSAMFRAYAKTPEELRFHRAGDTTSGHFCAYGWWAKNPQGATYWKCLSSEDTCFHFEDDAIAPSPAFSLFQGDKTNCISDDSASKSSCFANGYMEIPINKRIIAYHASVEFSPDRSFQMFHGTVSAHDQTSGIALYYEATTHEVVSGTESIKKEAAYEGRFFVSTGPQFCDPSNCDASKDGRTTVGYINDISYAKLFGLIDTGNSFGRRVLFTAYEKMYSDSTNGMGKQSKELKGRNFDRWNSGGNCDMGHFAQLESKFTVMRESNIGYAPPGTQLSSWFSFSGMGDYFKTISDFLDIVAETASPYGCASSFMRGVARTPWLENHIGREENTHLTWEEKQQNNDYDAFEMAVWAHFMAETPKNIKLTDIADRNWGGNYLGLDAIWGMGTLPGKQGRPTLERIPVSLGRTSASASLMNNVVTSNAPGVGGWGGTCTCPNGETYQVGDVNDHCGSLACEGGRSGKCNKDHGPWSFNSVKCGV